MAHQQAVQVKISPEQAIRDHGLLKVWVAKQMGNLAPSILSRLLTGEIEWTEKYRSSFAAAVGFNEDAIDFAIMSARRAEKTCIDASIAPEAPGSAPAGVSGPRKGQSTRGRRKGAQGANAESGDDR